MLGSAFLMTKESPITQEARETMIALNLDDPEFRTRVMTPKLFDPKAPHKTSTEINWAKAASFAAAGIPRIFSVKELLDHITSEAAAVLKERRFQIG